MFNFLKVLVVMSMIFALTPSPVSAEESLSIDVVTSGNTTMVTIHGAWWLTVQADPAWTDVEFHFPDIELFYTGIESGTISIYDRPQNCGGQLLEEFTWEKQYYQYLPVITN